MRRFWQIHLSTAVMAMVVASMMLGLNVRRRSVEIIEGYTKSGRPNLDPSWQYGWPANMATVSLVSYKSLSIEVDPWVRWDRIPPWDPYWNGLNLGINVAAFIILLSSTLAFFEWFARRRERLRSELS